MPLPSRLPCPEPRVAWQSAAGQPVLCRAADADDVVIIGAGPAGLTAAFELARKGKTCTVLEADDTVGGISRTVERDGWRFDIGGHRFFTKVKAVEDFWHEILPDDEFMLRPRMSRIYYQGKYYDYPLKPLNALRNLGLIESLRCAASYAWARVHPPRTRAPSRAGWPLVLVGASTNIFSRPTPRKSGVTPAPNCKRTGPPSGSRTSTFSTRSRTLFSRKKASGR